MRTGIAFISVVALFAAAAHGAGEDAGFFENRLVRVPLSLKPAKATPGEDGAVPAVSIPLKDGTSIEIFNETGNFPGEGGGAAPRNVAEGRPVTRISAAAGKLHCVKVQFGDSTLFAYRRGRLYRGALVSMGAEYVISVKLPPGRVFDKEIRRILKRVGLAPLPGCGVEAAIAFYGGECGVPAKERAETVKKIARRRPQCCELLELLIDAAQDSETVAWCEKRLSRWNPAKYGSVGADSADEYDPSDPAQRAAVEELCEAAR